MAIQIGSNKVKHVYVKDKGYCTKVQKSDGTVMWSEYYGTYTTGTLPTGVLSLVCNRTSHIEPTATNKALFDGDELYYGDTLTWTANASEGYSAGVKQSSFTISSQATLEPGVNGVSVSGAYATLNEPTSLTAPYMYCTYTTLGKISRCVAHARNDNSVTVQAYYKTASATGWTGPTAVAPNGSTTVGFTTSTTTGYCKFAYTNSSGTTIESATSSINMSASGLLG